MRSIPRLIHRPSTFAIVLGLFAAALAPGPARADDTIERGLADALRPLDGLALRTGVLYDRVLPLSGIERYDGSAAAATPSLATWRQLYDELRRASSAPFQ